MHDQILRAMTVAVDAEVGALALYVPEDAALQIVSTIGYPRSIVEHLRLNAGEGVIGRVYASGREFLMSETERPPVWPHRPRYRTESCIAIPLRHSHGSIGVVSVADPRSREHFTRDDLAALRRLVPVATLALERFRAYDELAAVASAARVDPLTGLANRRYLHSRVQAEIERALRLQQPLGMVLLDIDDFKRVNDTWGHVEGDHVLREVGQLLVENVRIFDVCTRYGGEEFAVVMPGATEAIVRQVAERVRRSVEDAFRGSLGGPKITLSAGGTLLESGDGPEQLFRRADAALLTAKRQGKNVVEIAAS
jgi:diguanylate cyclase (GGDEF)-like protein